MSILVTGASGFLGRAVVERLCAHKIARVRCFVRPRSNRYRLEQLQREHPDCRIEYFAGNLTSPADCRGALEGITTVFHLAAQMKGAPASIFLNTVVASNRLIEAMLETGTRRTVLVSSVAVYGPMHGPPTATLDEATPIERCAQMRDVYSQAKLWQESLFRRFWGDSGHELVVLRPGVIYGEGGQEFSPRVGLKIGNWLWRFGRNNVLPLTYVRNCAEAVVVAGLELGATGCYNVVDDDLPTVTEYLNQYRRWVGSIRSIWIPWWLTRCLSRAVETYSQVSHEQLPAVLTTYKSAVLWRGSSFDNRRLKQLAWRPIVPTAEALRTTFESFKNNSETMPSFHMSSQARAGALSPRLSCDAEG